ncbi:recombinase family protein [Shewanella sp. GD03713]|uniref:recombinase family protein n=1 Tax=Shewanella sp. GD03713 TaxID=2975372 RepID=UPI002446EB63|nr:recombinase family protein [Shewanella sp. GD03713]MDH1472140.1 recombinase family protein [Shewanella sp. GD03713]
MDIGYIRVSTAAQNTDRQLAHVELDMVITEKLSAKSINRPEWNRCKQLCRINDTLHIHSLDRVCRSGAGDAVAIVEEMTAKGVSIVFHKEGLTFNGTLTAAQKGVLSILAAVSQMERELINERRLEGIEAAKSKGKYAGRPSVQVSKDDIEAKLSTGVTKEKAAKELGIGVATLYRILKQ